MAVFLTMLLVMGMAATVNAAGPYTITIDNSTEGHTYTAYQIFKGDLDTNSAILSNIEWGSGVNGSALLAALKTDTQIGSAFTACTTAADVAKVLGGYSNDSDELQAFAAVAKDHLKSESGTSSVYSDSKYTITGLDAGYYLVRDTGTVSGDDDAATRFILKLAGDVEVTPKSDKPSVEKKVQEDDKYGADKEANNPYGTGYNDVADYDIGSNVPFKLIGTVPDMTGYETYQYIFHDTLSTGLSLNAESIKVYLADSKNADLSTATQLTKDTDYAVKTTSITDNCTFEIKISDLTKIPNISSDKFIIVAYTAELTSGATVGLAGTGNINTVKLEYSNDPYNSASTGETLEDRVIVFTYKLETTKTDIEETGTKLRDAKFVLLSSDGTKVAKVSSDDKLVEWVDVVGVAASGTPTLEEWETYDANLRASGDADKVILTSGSNGLFSVTGLDDGTYRLREIEAPDGYNLLTEDVDVVITATTVNGQTWDGTAANALTKLTVKAANKDGTGDVNTGTASITIGNGKGIQLPSTGGAGTTLFYIAGAILAVGAGVFLIVRRRMGSDR